MQAERHIRTTGPRRDLQRGLRASNDPHELAGASQVDLQGELPALSQDDRHRQPGNQRDAAGDEEPDARPEVLGDPSDDETTCRLPADVDHDVERHHAPADAEVGRELGQRLSGGREGDAGDADADDGAEEHPVERGEAGHRRDRAVDHDRDHDRAQTDRLPSGDQEGPDESAGGRQRAVEPVAGCSGAVGAIR